MIKHYELPKDHAYSEKLYAYPNIYTIESLVKPSIIYGVSDGKFAIFRANQARVWNIEDTPEVAEYIVHDGIKAEILAIYEDIKFLQTAQVLVG